MAQKVTPQSGNFITRLNDRLDDWLQRYLPHWLYKQVTFQPDDRALRPDNNKLAIVYSLLIIAGAIIILILSLQWSGLNWPHHIFSRDCNARELSERFYRKTRRIIGLLCIGYGNKNNDGDVENSPSKDNQSDKDCYQPD